MFGSNIPNFDKLLDEISLKSSKAEIMPVPFKSSSGFSNSSKIEGKPVISNLRSSSFIEISNCASLSPRCVSATVTTTSISNVNSSRPRLPVIESAKIPITESNVNSRKIQNVPFLQHGPGLFLKPHTEIPCHDLHLERCATKSENRRFERLATSKDSPMLDTKSDIFLSHLDSVSRLKRNFTCEDEHPSKAQKQIISNESKLKRNATKCKTYNGCSAEETSFDADSEYRASPVPKREKKPIDRENTSSDTNCVETSSQISLCKSVSATFSRSESSLQEASPAHSSRSESSKTSLSSGYNSDVLTKPRRSSTTPETLNTNSDTEKRNRELSLKEKLQFTILPKRDVKKEEEIKVEPFEMTCDILRYPELRKRERKREQNKRSARKSRDKQKQNEQLVQKKYQDVYSEHHTLQREIQQLKSEKKHLCTRLIHHLKNECKLKQREEHLERIKKFPVSIIPSLMACRGLEKPSANFVTAGLQDTTIRKSNDKCERGNKL